MGVNRPLQPGCPGGLISGTHPEPVKPPATQIRGLCAAKQRRQPSPGTLRAGTGARPPGPVPITDDNARGNMTVPDFYLANLVSLW